MFQVFKCGNASSFMFRWCVLFKNSLIVVSLSVCLSYWSDCILLQWIFFLTRWHVASFLQVNNCINWTQPMFLIQKYLVPINYFSLSGWLINTSCMFLHLLIWGSTFNVAARNLIWHLLLRTDAKKREKNPTFRRTVFVSKKKS